jgi:hypothetical protein
MRKGSILRPKPGWLVYDDGMLESMDERAAQMTERKIPPTATKKKSKSLTTLSSMHMAA